MEFFGITMFGPQNYVADMMIEKYKEPMSKEAVKPLMEKVKEYSTLPERTPSWPIHLDRAGAGIEIFVWDSGYFCEYDAEVGVMEKVVQFDGLYRTLNHNLDFLYAQIERPDVDVTRVIDVYIGRVNGFAYGSSERFKKMKRKGVMLPPFPCDMYRFPPTTYLEYGWWQHDPELLKTDWYVTNPRFSQPTSPNTLILDKVRKNNKYATLF